MKNIEQKNKIKKNEESPVRMMQSFLRVKKK